ncbi:hypothetical protein NC990_16605 [Funiculus sociatus GB2-M1]|nr:hypothetical protein [Trichocoleus sp. FACHB-6]
MLGFVPQPNLRGDAIALPANSEADNLINKLTLDTISIDTAVGHDGFIEDNIFKANFIESFDSAQINITEVNISETNLAKSSIFKDSLAKVDTTEVTLTENSIAKINSFQATSLSETAFIHTYSDELSKAQVNLIKSTGIKIGVAEVRFSVDTTSNYLINPMRTSKVTSSEIFFSPSVLSNQFFSIHNSTPQTINNINSIAQDFWNSYLNPSTPSTSPFK